MKKLSDKQFDDLLRQKAESFDFDFDESAWGKMEQKLRKRDRVIFIRNSSFIFLFLLLSVGALLLYTHPASETIKVAKHTQTHSNIGKNDPLHSPTDKERNSSDVNTAPFLEQSDYTSARIKAGNTLETFAAKTLLQNNTGNSFSNTQNEIILDRDTAVISQTALEVAALANLNPTNIKVEDSIASEREVNKLPRKRKPLTFSITALAGPEFSSTNSIAGKKGNAAIGFLLNTTLSDKITFSTGLKYGLKDYQASAYSYQLKNPYMADQISRIDASCNVLEIPLQVSYALINNSKRKIAVSSGLSSYLMLKEEYNFRYTPQSGREDYLLVKNNENQHYLSVLSLSASYHIKPKSSKIQWAIEPYVKLPLGGVGEGNVKLKSSGVSLNLTYDISKKNK